MIPLNMTMIMKNIVDKDNIFHVLLDFPLSENEASSIVRLEPVPLDLEYVFKLVSESFSYISSEPGYFPTPEGFYWSHFQVYHIPFKDLNNPSEVFHRNTLISSLVNDFESRLQKNEWNIDIDKLSELIHDSWRNFEVEDRKRLDVKKLFNLIFFVMDFCRLTMFNSKVHPFLFDYIQVPVRIGGKSYLTSRRTADRIKAYLKEPFIYVNSNKMINFQLPSVSYDSIIPNFQAYDKASYLAAMFIETMHNFFLSFGLKKRKGATWSPAEVSLLYDVLRFYGVCTSNKLAKQSTYVKTTMNGYKDYFEKCKLYSWIRYDQEYSYLINRNTDVVFTLTSKLNYEK